MTKLELAVLFVAMLTARCYDSHHMIIYLIMIFITKPYLFLKMLKNRCQYFNILICTTEHQWIKMYLIIKDIKYS